MLIKNGVVMKFLLIERGTLAGERIALAEFPVTIGRDPTNRLVLKDEHVSRFHARIKERGLIFVIEDLDSRNGTYVNGDRIINATIQNGDKILIGSAEMTFLAPHHGIELGPMASSIDASFADPGFSMEIESAEENENLRRAMTYKRHDPLQIVKNIGGDVKLIKTIFDVHSNILVMEGLHEASEVMLKGLGSIVPSLARAAFFVWNKNSRQLQPLSHRSFKGANPFTISHHAFQDALVRKLVVNGTSNEKEGKAILVLPMIANSEVIGLAHLETEGPIHLTMRHIEAAQALLTRSASIFESMLLRRELDLAMVGMLETMIATVEAKDTYTRGHSERVSKFSMAIADELKLNRDLKKLLMTSALLHDIGKIGIPDAILKKATILSAEEYAEIKLHPVIGADIISHLPNAKRFLSGVKYHHEKWDGTGYPEGLTGEDIPFFGRIVAIADVFDAMVSGRSYSGFVNIENAIEKLSEDNDIFDPEILKAFLKAYESGRLQFKGDTQN